MSEPEHPATVTSREPPRSVAFVGLSAIGLPMALRLAAAGHTVIGYDVSDTARDAAAASGLQVATSLRDAAAAAGVAILMLPSSDVVDDVVLAQGLADALPSGALVRVSVLVPPARIERATTRLGGGCSIRLSYGGLTDDSVSGRRQDTGAPGSLGAAGATRSETDGRCGPAPLRSRGGERARVGRPAGGGPPAAVDAAHVLR